MSASVTAYDPELRVLTGAAGSVRLRRGSGKLLMLFLKRQNQLVSRDHALFALHGVAGNSIAPKSCDVAIHRLRKEILKIESNWQITTIRDAGWVLEERNKSWVK